MEDEIEIEEDEEEDFFNLLLPIGNCKGNSSLAPHSPACCSCLFNSQNVLYIFLVEVYQELHCFT